MKKFSKWDIWKLWTKDVVLEFFSRVTVKPSVFLVSSQTAQFRRGCRGVLVNGSEARDPLKLCLFAGGGEYVFGSVCVHGGDRQSND